MLSRDTSARPSWALAIGSTPPPAETLTIATVNNGDMVRMQELTEDFTATNPDIELEWVTLRGTCCANAHHRYCHQRWPVRRHDHRHL